MNVSGEGYTVRSTQGEPDVGPRARTGWLYTRATSAPERCGGGGRFGGRWWRL